MEQLSESRNLRDNQQPKNQHISFFSDPKRQQMKAMRRNRRKYSSRDDPDSNPSTRKEGKRHTRMPARSLEEINFNITEQAVLDLAYELHSRYLNSFHNDGISGASPLLREIISSEKYGDMLLDIYHSTSITEAQKHCSTLAQTAVMGCLGTDNQLPGESNWLLHTYQKKPRNNGARRQHLKQSSLPETQRLLLFKEGKLTSAMRGATGDDYTALRVLERFASKLSSVDLETLTRIFRDIKERLSGLRGAGRANTGALKIHLDERLVPNSLRKL